MRDRARRTGGCVCAEYYAISDAASDALLTDLVMETINADAELSNAKQHRERGCVRQPDRAQRMMRRRSWLGKTLSIG